MYLESVQFSEIVSKLYPYKNVLRSADIAFARSCQQVMNTREAFEQYLSILKPLNENSADLIPALTTYLLDTPSNMVQTAKLLFVHLNTVKGVNLLIRSLI